MNKNLISVLVMLLLSSPTTANESVKEIIATKVKFPSVTVACIPLELPSDVKTAKKIVFEKRGEWDALAYEGKLNRYGYPFVDAIIEKRLDGDEDSSPVNDKLQGRMCGVIERSITTVPGMSVDRWNVKEGTAGYCVGKDVEACLESAFKDSGFTEKMPWHRLPIYAPWNDDLINPTSAMDVISVLSTPILEGPPELPPSNTTHFKHSGGLKPIDINVKPAPEIDKTEVEVHKIGWFIEAPQTLPSQ